MSDDQAQGQEQTESNESEEKETGSEDKQEAQDQEQSKKGKSEQELFKLPDGREVDSKTLSKEWKENFYPEFTKRSQKLKEYEKKEAEKAKEAEGATRQTLSEDEKLKNVPPDVREAIVKITTPVVKQLLKQKDEETSKREADKVFETKLINLEKQFPGGDGKPKFDRNEVLESMKDPENKVFDPEVKFEQLHQKEFNDILIKEALTKQKGTAPTERTGTGESGKPDKKTPKTFLEAGASAMQRLKNS